MEMIVTLAKDKEIVNRGFLIGPYCPIYGVCSIAMILLLSKTNDPILLFILSIIICSVGEYLTSYLMEKIFKARWWDYSKIKFNINGRICLRNCLAFGILGFLVVKYINVSINNLYLNLSTISLNIIFYSLLIIFVSDLIISFNVINKVKKMSIKYVNLDNTKEITEKVRKILSKKLLPRRLLSAYPNVKFLIKEKINNLKSKANKK
jgi:uncharacterized membrane protein